MLEIMRQTMVEMDTGGDCFVKQVVDVFLPLGRRCEREIATREAFSAQ